MRDFGRQRRILRRGGTPRLRRCLVVRYHRGRSRPQRCFAGPDGGEPGRGACRSSGQHACGMHGSAGGCKGVGSDPRLRILSRGRACAGLARGARPAATGRASRIYCGAPSHLSSRLTPMDRRVKERLVGASILVVLIVLIVPELLSGPPVPAPAPVGARLPASAPEPVRNVTVDLATSKAPEPPEAEPPASSAQPPEPRSGEAASAVAGARMRSRPRMRRSPRIRSARRTCAPRIQGPRRPRRDPSRLKQGRRPPFQRRRSRRWRERPGPCSWAALRAAPTPINWCAD